VLSWGTILASAGLTALATLLGMAPFDRPFDPRRLLTAAVAAGSGPLLWQLLTRGSSSGELTRAWDQAAFPVARTHAGVALATLATTALVLSLGPDRKLAARRMIVVPIGAAMAAFGIAVYLT